MSEVNEIKKSQAVHDGDRKYTDLQSRVRSLENLCYSAKEVLNLEEAASFLGIAKSTLYKMTHENRIPFYKPAGLDPQQPHHVRGRASGRSQEETP